MTVTTDIEFDMDLPQPTAAEIATAAKKKERDDIAIQLLCAIYVAHTGDRAKIAPSSRMILNALVVAETFQRYSQYSLSKMKAELATLPLAD